uniref:Uncharacterized protein n=1 Tax=Cacopsylla melanoneura TaxID=428564 RepID=A0A8D8WHQ5_9HEMI
MPVKFLFIIRLELVPFQLCTYIIYYLLYCIFSISSNKTHIFFFLKKQKRLEVSEMGLLWRRSCEVITNKIKVTEVTKKIQERRLQWYGHVMRRDEDYVGRKVRRIEVEGRRGRGRPKKKWEHCVNSDLNEKGLTGDEVHDRAKWKFLV